MSKTVRILVVLACVAIVAAAGLNGGAWADRLRTSDSGPSTGITGEVLQAGSRPKGTVPTKPPCVKTKVPGKFTIGSIAEWALDKVPGGKTHEACVAKESDLPAKMPGALLSSPIKLNVNMDPGMTVDQRVCYPVPPGKTASAYYWDGKAWVETEEAENGQACVTVPADAKATTFVGMCEEP